MPRKENPGPISAQAQQELVSEGIENYELPKSIVMKIAKSALPEEARLTKETVLSLVKGSTVFINYLAATAHDVALSKQHKSIAASDVLKALELVDFGDLVDPLTEELKVYKDTAKSSTKKPRRDSTAAAPSASTAGKSFSISIPAQ
ncbi:histone-fold-containing protein, partial [Ephemerocybe angulata]